MSTNNLINNVIKKLESKHDLNREDLSFIVETFEKNNINEEEIKKLVIAWRTKGETANEIAGLAEILLLKQKQINDFYDSLDICGTGGDKSNTYNISTVSAIIASSCGIKVIKHSGRSTTSISGSVDILKHFGCEIDLPKEIKESCFKKTNLMFTSSKILRDLFGKVKIACKSLNMPGFVNLLGPLVNPYKTKYQILGVSNPKWGTLMSEALKILNKNNVIVVCSEISKDLYLDEFSLCGKNYIWKINDNKITEEIIRPEDINENIININELKIKNTDEGKLIFEGILKGTLNNKSKNPKVKTVALNVGFALYLSKVANSIPIGYKQALEHIESAKGWEHFQNFLNFSKKSKE